MRTRVANAPLRWTGASGQIVGVTLDRTSGTSAEQVTRDEHDASDGEGPFRPRRPNASPAPADQTTAQQTVVLPLGGSAEPAAPVQAPDRRRREAVAVGLAIATFLALVGAAIWVGSGFASRDAAPVGGGGSRLPAGPSAGSSAGDEPVVSASATAAPSTSAPITSQPAAPAQSRTRTTPPLSRSVRATVSVVNDGGGAFQLALVVNNTSAATQAWEVVITFPVRVTQLRAIGNGTLSTRNNQAIVRGTSGPGETAVAIGGVTSDGSTLRTWTCTVNGQAC